MTNIAEWQRQINEKTMGVTDNGNICFNNLHLSILSRWNEAYFTSNVDGDISSDDSV